MSFTKSRPKSQSRPTLTESQVLECLQKLSRCGTKKNGCGGSGCDADKKDDTDAKDVDLRFIHVAERIDDAAAAKFIAKLELLNRRSAETMIVVYISSPGGSVSAGLAIYDAIKCLPAPVITVVAGMAASAASLIAQAGEMRLIMPNGRILIHEPYFGMLFGARKKDLRRANESLTWALERTISILTERSQLPRETIEKWLETETTLDADAALKCHLVDGVYGQDTWLSIQGLRNKKCGGCQGGGCGKKKSVKKSKKK